LQHAVIQFREKQITKELTLNEQQERGVYQPFINETVVKPYIMDLESTNKTFLNGDELEGARYYELREKDILKFGDSQREYVLMKT
jgi:smad nuclear-interacting protein 1